MKLNSFFERIYCINLPHRRDRRQHCERIFKALDWHVNFFQATDGHTIEGIGTVDGPHAANKLAHIAIITGALAMNFESILILEDDILVAKNTEGFLATFLDFMPTDWELCYLGWIEWLQHQSEKSSTYAQRVTEMNGTHAMGINRSVMWECLKAHSLMDARCDGAMAKYIQPRGHAYAPSHNLITQGCFGSDLHWKPEILRPERLKEFV